MTYEILSSNSNLETKRIQIRLCFTFIFMIFTSHTLFESMQNMSANQLPQYYLQKQVFFTVLTASIN